MGVTQEHTRTPTTEAWTLLVVVTLSYLVVLYGVPTIGFTMGILFENPQEIGGALGASMIWVTILAVLCSPAILLMWGGAVLARTAVRRAARPPETAGSRLPRLTSLTMCRYWVWLTTVVVGFGSLFGTYAGLAPARTGGQLLGLGGLWVGAAALTAVYTVLSVWLVHERSRRTILRLWLPLVACSMVLPALIRWTFLAL